MVGFMSTSAVAETVQDHYKTITNRVPYTESVCNWIDVPIYGQSSGSTGDTIFGAIIGGAIGNQFGGGKGKDAATILGAIVGADVANKNSKKGIIGYKQERQCTDYTRYNEQQQQVYSHSTVTFKSDGKTYSLSFKK